MGPTFPGTVVVVRVRRPEARCASRIRMMRCESVSTSNPGTANGRSCVPTPRRLSVVESAGYRSDTLCPGATRNKATYAGCASCTVAARGGTAVSTAVMRGSARAAASPSPSAPPPGLLAHPAPTRVIDNTPANASRTHHLTMLPYTIMNPIPTSRRARGACLVLALLVPAVLAGQVASSIASKTTGFERREGFIPVYVDARSGKLLLELPRDSARALLLISQATGLGSNPIGIDRGASADDHLVRFEREGDRVQVVLENWRYRSTATENADHQRTIREAFPSSTIAAMPLLAEEQGRLLVDATDFVLRDWTDVAGTLSRAQQGTYSLARDRSGINRALTRGFPDNSEIDLNLTYAVTSGRPGGIVSQIVPDGRALTLRQHLTLHRLPDPNYRPRELDPRVGYFGIAFHDFANPIQEPLVERWAARHRLERVT